jgi:dihydroxyacetone kinase phosphotransfer subunit
MVGIVIVSHSNKVAEGVKDIAEQMADKNQNIIAAGGMATGEIGTDAVLISEAIEKADAGEGVVVLVDLGSAVLSTNMALELLKGRLSNPVKVADAPLLEGTLSAVVRAACGGTLDEVVNEAVSTRYIMKL